MITEMRGTFIALKVQAVIPLVVKFVNNLTNHTAVTCGYRYVKNEQSLANSFAGMHVSSNAPELGSATLLCNSSI